MTRPFPALPAMLLLSSTLLLVLLPAPLQAATVIRVPADVNNIQTAIDTVPDGGIIEIAAGTYPSPSEGFFINDEGKSFTMRAATGASVTLTGNGTNQVLRYINFGARGDQSVRFERLTFANGFSSVAGRAGGITLSNAAATFVDCELVGNNAFADNSGAPNAAGAGGAVLLNVGFSPNTGSLAHFIGCTFEDNLASNDGGAMRIFASEAYVHDSTFTGNRSNPPGHRVSSTGGAISMSSNADGTAIEKGILKITDSRFENNIAGCAGGAIYALGKWTDPGGTPPRVDQPNVIPNAILTVANSTFVDNQVSPDPGISCLTTPVGGAIHSENQALNEIYNSRFDTNSSDTGGAVNSYRSEVVIEGSIFRGNRAVGTGTSTGFGGAIMSNSNDANVAAGDDVGVNRPTARLTVRDSWVQGRFGNITTTGNRAGCLFAEGDSSRTYGRDGVPILNGLAENRVLVTIENTAFFDCNIQQDDPGTGTGGAIVAGHAKLNMTDSVILGADAFGATAAGGAMVLQIATDATFLRTTFAENSAQDRGGALLIAGAALDVDDSQFFDNTVVSGSPTGGGAIRARPEVLNFGGPTFNIDLSGEIRNSVFSGNTPLDILETNDTETGPISSLTYNNNRFHTTQAVGRVFFNNLVGPAGKTVAELNSLTIVRSGAANTDKSPSSNNVALGSVPSLGALLAAPPRRLPTNAPGDPAPPTQAYVGYAWTGGTATLNGGAVTTSPGSQIGGSQTHTLSVTGAAQPFTDTIVDAAIPAGTFAATPVAISGGGSSNLGWSTTGGTFLDARIDRGVANASTASGMALVSPAETQIYNLCLMTKEGGVSLEATVFVDESPPIFTDGFESGNVSAWSSSVGVSP